MAQAIRTDRAPAAIGPYSQAVVSGGLVFCSGQIPIDPATGQAETTDVAAQAARAIANLTNVLAAAGLSLDAVVKTTVFLTDLADFDEVNQVYAAMFSPICGPVLPARSTVQVAALPKGARVEIEAIAVAQSSR